LWSGLHDWAWVVVVHIADAASDREGELAAKSLVLSLVPEWGRRPPFAVSTFEMFTDVTEDDVLAVVELRKR
jgi:hypothetical protein